MTPLFDSLARQALDHRAEITSLSQRASLATASGFDLTSTGNDLSWTELQARSLSASKTAPPSTGLAAPHRFDTLDRAAPAVETAEDTQPASASGDTTHHATQNAEAVHSAEHSTPTASGIAEAVAPSPFEEEAPADPDDDGATTRAYAPAADASATPSPSQTPPENEGPLAGRDVAPHLESSYEPTTEALTADSSHPKEASFVIESFVPRESTRTGNKSGKHDNWSSARSFERLRAGMSSSDVPANSLLHSRSQTTSRESTGEPPPPASPAPQASTASQLITSFQPEHLSTKTRRTPDQPSEATDARLAEPVSALAMHMTKSAPVNKRGRESSFFSPVVDGIRQATALDPMDTFQRVSALPEVQQDASHQLPQEQTAYKVSSVPPTNQATLAENALEPLTTVSPASRATEEAMPGIAPEKLSAQPNQGASPLAISVPFSRLPEERIPSLMPTTESLAQPLPAPPTTQPHEPVHTPMPKSANISSNQLSPSDTPSSHSFNHSPSVAPPATSAEAHPHAAILPATLPTTQTEPTTHGEVSNAPSLSSPAITVTTPANSAALKVGLSATSSQILFSDSSTAFQVSAFEDRTELVQLRAAEQPLLRLEIASTQGKNRASSTALSFTPTARLTDPPESPEHPDRVLDHSSDSTPDPTEPTELQGSSLEHHKSRLAAQTVQIGFSPTAPISPIRHESITPVTTTLLTHDRSPAQALMGSSPTKSATSGDLSSTIHPAIASVDLRGVTPQHPSLTRTTVMPPAPRMAQEVEVPYHPPQADLQPPSSDLTFPETESSAFTISATRHLTIPTVAHPKKPGLSHSIDAVSMDAIVDRLGDRKANPGFSPGSFSPKQETVPGPSAPLSRLPSGSSLHPAFQPAASSSHFQGLSIHPPTSLPSTQESAEQLPSLAVPTPATSYAPAPQSTHAIPSSAIASSSPKRGPELDTNLPLQRVVRPDHAHRIPAQAALLPAHRTNMEFLDRTGNAELLRPAAWLRTSPPRRAPYPSQRAETSFDSAAPASLQQDHAVAPVLPASPQVNATDRPDLPTSFSSFSVTAAPQSPSLALHSKSRLVTTSRPHEKPPANVLSVSSHENRLEISAVQAELGRLSPNILPPADGPRAIASAGSTASPHATIARTPEKTISSLPDKSSTPSLSTMPVSRVEFAAKPQQQPAPSIAHSEEDLATSQRPSPSPRNRSIPLTTAKSLPGADEWLPSRRRTHATPEPPPPPVRIHIERISIEPPARQASRPVRPSPQLSLGQYLRRRSRPGA
jgi:hypothetical protein